MTQPTAALGFLPWIRTGLAGDIARADGDTTAPPGPRAVVSATLTVDAAGDLRPVPVTLPLLGPGEIAAIDPRAVIRVAPRAGELDAEPNEFPQIEFAEVDLPWRYTPAIAGPGGRLRPWFVLAVLRDDEITDRQPASGDGRLSAITVASGSSLPLLDQSWAWAHVQIDGFAPGTETLASVDPARQRARVIAPRRLDPKTAYTAVLVPAFERGRRAGLRDPVTDDIDALAPAWAPGDSAIRLPVYYQWMFGTGVQADFEQLARRLTGRAADATLGTIALDVSAPDPALPAAATAPLTFSGALVSPAAAIPAWPDVDRTPFVAALADLLNRPADAVDHGTDPIVAPPLWGRWHAAVSRMATDPDTAPQWFQQVNADPRWRTTAGLGAEVIRRNDDALMAEAWQQVGAVVAANEALRRAQLAREASTRLHTNHLSTLDADTLLQVTASTHAHVLVDATASDAERLTAAGQLRISPVPDGATDGRMRRARGAVARRAAIRSTALASVATAGQPPAGRPVAGQPVAGQPVAGQPGVSAAAGFLGRLNSGELRTRPNPTVPSGIVTVQISVPAAAGHGTVFGGVHVGSELTAADLAPIAALKPSQPDDPPDKPLPDPVPPVHIPAPASGWLPGVAGGLLGSGSDKMTPVPITTDPRDSAVVAATAQLFGQAMVGLVTDVQAAPEAGAVLRPADLDAIRQAVTVALDPAATIPAGMRTRMTFAPWIEWDPVDPLQRVMAAPEFDTPMYEPLRDLGPDWLMPGAGSLLPDTVSVVVPNQAFIEAYLLGLSVEMGRELLFHEYPTDQRGTYFPQFWDTRGALTPAGALADPATLHDITAITEWRADAGLGANSGRVPAPTGHQLVLLVKGELLSRYPNTIVSAVDAVIGTDGARTLGDDSKYPIFSGRLGPDIAFFGFDLTVDAARGTGVGTDLGWFFVLAEHPTEPRFGLDADNGQYAAKPVVWDDLNWADLAAGADALASIGYIDLTAPLPDVTSVVGAAGDPAVAWHPDGGGTGSDLAWITLRRPFRVALHGDDVLPKAAP